MLAPTTDNTARLAQVRTVIDSLDYQIVILLAERGRWVAEAAKAKSAEREVPAPERVEQVIRKVCAVAAEHGLEADVAEATYRAMIAAFIASERRTFRMVGAVGIEPT